ncbi:hypothetical protein B9G69_006375 [Bdellovibrio sp. SKB1291214]|uniref:hypothetical protein n=1 Tax=Bdellovibrio sp. SKB1291214 TaxID=1732569 RepID=UPI000B51E2DB|nr:hypothetical protein [Bdellovibrio sp. SKB1291214]UYL10203.1 hypothetical protein B9G69_006375 [Bdellovibrio sp. SKB1291214]
MGFIWSVLLLLSSMLCAGKCMAGVELSTTKKLVIPVDNVTPRITTTDVNRVIPTDNLGAETTSSMMGRIADRSFNLWFNSDVVQESLLGRVVQETQETLKTDVVVPAATQQGISHKFSFRVEAFQALAKMEYKGWLNAAINYNARASETDVEVKEKVFDNKDLIVSHKGTSRDSLAMIGLAWQW